jgi:alpha-glucosidase
MGSLKQESTQYGLRNYLRVLSFKKAALNRYLILCENYKNQKRVFLHLLFVTPEIIRLHYSFNGDFQLSANPFLELSSFDFTEKNFVHEEKSESNFLLLKGSALEVLINKQPFCLEIREQRGKTLSLDVPELGFWSSALNNSLKPEVRCYKAYPDLEKPPIIYGLGDKTGTINRWGKRFINSPIDALGYDSKNTDPLYKDIPFFMHLDPKTKIAHGIFFDNFHKKFFDFGKERKPTPYYYFGAEGGELNYYFIAGPKLEEVLARYLNLTGKPVLMPAFSFGYLASGMAYTEDPGSANYISKTLDKFTKLGIKTSAFHLSSGYTLDKNLKRLQFNWNKEKFPDPKKFAQKCLDKGVELCANVKPVLLCAHPEYAEAEKCGLFIKDRKGKTLIVDYWGGPGSYLDFTNKDTQAWWSSKLKESLLAKGVRGIWNDNNEYEIFDEHQNSGQETQMPLIMSELAYKNSLELKPKQRPWVLSRSGYSGIQKFAQTWTGDNYSSFEALQYDSAIISSMGISGLVHAGSDIGGFWGKAPDYELLCRWIQAGIFSPRFCIHSYKPIPTEASSHMKKHPQSFKIIKDFMQLREELRPYIYQANYLAASKGKAIQRITAFDYQDDEQAYEQSFEYLFGESLLIAPVYESLYGKKLLNRKTYLPKAKHSWINFFSGKEFPAGTYAEEKISLKEIPAYVKADSVIPMIRKDRLELRVFLSGDFFKKKHMINYEFYEDDGDSLNYMQGQFLKTAFSIRAHKTNKKILSVKISKSQGKYKSPFEKVTIVIIFHKKAFHYTHHRREFEGTGIELELKEALTVKP